MLGLSCLQYSTLLFCFVYNHKLVIKDNLLIRQKIAQKTLLAKATKCIVGTSENL